VAQHAAMGCAPVGSYATYAALGVPWTNASSEAMVVLMFFLRVLRLRANTG
jgi:hypothetical protein